MRVTTVKSLLEVLKTYPPEAKLNVLDEAGRYASLVIYHGDASRQTAEITVTVNSQNSGR